MYKALSFLVKLDSNGLSSILLVSSGILSEVSRGSQDTTTILTFKVSKTAFVSIQYLTCSWRLRRNLRGLDWAAILSNSWVKGYCFSLVSPRKKISPKLTGRLSVILILRFLLYLSHNLSQIIPFCAIFYFHLCPLLYFDWQLRPALFLSNYRVQIKSKKSPQMEKQCTTALKGFLEWTHCISVFLVSLENFARDKNHRTDRFGSFDEDGWVKSISRQWKLFLDLPCCCCYNCSVPSTPSFESDIDINSWMLLLRPNYQQFTKLHSIKNLKLNRA